MKRLADLLTALRFVLAVPIVLIGATQPAAQGLPPVVWLTMIAWTTDALDGPLAQRATIVRQTWLGRRDLEADLSVMLALGVTMAVWGMLIPVLLALGVIAAWLTWIWLGSERLISYLRSGVWGERNKLSVRSAPLQATIGIIYGGFMVGVLYRQPALGGALWGWLGVSMALVPRRTWHRFRGFWVVGWRFLVRREEPGLLEAEADSADPALLPLPEAEVEQE
jgi:phosphatidylglycerophosphate synthase